MNVLLLSNNSVISYKALEFTEYTTGNKIPNEGFKIILQILLSPRQQLSLLIVRKYEFFREHLIEQ